MPKCPLCSSRPAKRRCPAKNGEICAVCCATKREVEIECPSDCVYLRQGQSYAAQTERDGPERPSREFSHQFRKRNAVFITALSEAVNAHRASDPSLLDQDVREAFSALRSTIKTLESGIYYETLPDHAPARALYQRVRPVVDQLLQPVDSGYPALRLADAPDVVDFVIVSVELHSGGRPKSRRFLDWLAAALPAQEPPPPAGDQGSRLILP